MPAGTVVVSGTLVSPGGQQGIPGTAGPNVVSTDAGNQAALGTDGKIYVPDPTPKIWSTRLRSFNSIGNPTSEVDQKFCGTALALTPSISGGIDRWPWYVNGTMRATVQQIAANVVLPGTSFSVTSQIQRITLTTAQASLGVNDFVACYSVVEGPSLRELINDVHSVSLLVRSSVANLKFGMLLLDGNTTAAVKGLGKLCTLGASNTWALIQLPNLPLWAAGGTFPITPGLVGYTLTIGLAAGSSGQIPVDTWQSGGNVASAAGVVGQSNFAASPVNSTFDLAFVQHEPGPLCTTLLDKPFTHNLDECLRYYQKTYRLGVKPGTVDSAGVIVMQTAANTNPLGTVRFFKPMARIPTIVGFSDVTGASGAVRDVYVPGDRGISTGPYNAGDSGFGGFALSTNNTTATLYTFNYTADTGW